MRYLGSRFFRILSQVFYSLAHACKAVSYALR